MEIGCEHRENREFNLNLNMATLVFQLLQFTDQSEDPC